MGGDLSRRTAGIPVTDARETDEDQYMSELTSMAGSFNELLLAYKNEVRKERNALSARLERQLLNMLETSDGLAGYLSRYEGKNVEGFEWVQTLYLDLQQKLERAGVVRVEPAEGEPYDEARHEIVNLADRPAGFNGRPAVRKVRTPGFVLKAKVLRRAGVEVNWVAV